MRRAAATTRPSIRVFFPARAFSTALFSAKRGKAAATRLRRHRGTTKVVSPENPCCLFFSRMQVRFPVAGPAGKIMLVDHQVRPRATDHRWPSGRGALTLVSSLLIAKRPLTLEIQVKRERHRIASRGCCGETPWNRGGEEGGGGGIVFLGSGRRTNFMQTNSPYFNYSLIIIRTCNLLTAAYSNLASCIILQRALIVPCCIFLRFDLRDLLFFMRIPYVIRAGIVSDNC